MLLFAEKTKHVIFITAKIKQHMAVLCKGTLSGIADFLFGIFIARWAEFNKCIFLNHLQTQP